MSRKIERDIAEVHKTWNAFRWLAKDRFEGPKVICAYASEGVESQVNAHDVAQSPNPQMIDDE